MTRPASTTKQQLREAGEANGWRLVPVSYGWYFTRDRRKVYVEFDANGGLSYANADRGPIRTDRRAAVLALLRTAR
jgi:hypothetical protein